MAGRVGLNPTDMECLGFLHLSVAGPTTAGQLAEETGLTTGAITAVIDRLERAGFARRADDPHDRRRVLVEALPKGSKVILPLFEPLARRMAELHSRYKDHELALILDYMKGELDASTQHMRWLHGLPARQIRSGQGRSINNDRKIKNTKGRRITRTKRKH